MLCERYVTDKTFSKTARIKSRRNAVQAIYQWKMTAIDCSELLKQFKTDRDELKKADIDYFDFLVRGVIQKQESILQNYLNTIDRKPEELDLVEQAVIELGIYELMHSPELPYRVVINEYVEAAKMFGAEESHKYINKILDKAAQEIRSLEINNVNS